jgi:UPF0755 protein
VAVVLVMAAAYVVLRSLGIVALGERGPRVDVVVPPGSSAARIGELLQHRGVVRSAFGFRIVARLTGAGSRIEAGRYELNRGLSAASALAVLEKGATAEFVRVTFPEGSRLTDFARILADHTTISAKSFVRVATSGEIRSRYEPHDVKTLEGLVFPSTYHIAKSDTAKTVVARLVAEFDRRASALDFSEARARGLSSYQAIIVASMIEAEAKVPSDRPKIAAVIYNRLKRHMRLRIDATIEYALGRHVGALTQSQLRVHSPYNTRTHYGLPPTPIGAPGLASLDAALNPAKGPWLYYVVADCEGHHAFSASYKRFLENVAAYSRLKC